MPIQSSVWDLPFTVPLAHIMLLFPDMHHRHLLPIIACLLLGCLPLQGQVEISEFMASNGETLADEDGDYSDWIELYNRGETPVNLDGWFLTDDASDPAKWRLPAVSMDPKGFLIVFASGKNRAVPSSPLHASFSLDAAGEYLALVQPDGVTVASAFAPEFPEQFRDLSYGVGQSVSTNLLLAGNAPARTLVPVDGALGSTWIQPGFDHSAWLAGPLGLGFETEVAGFAVHNYKANLIVDNLAAADGVIANPGRRVGVVSENARVINYFNTGSDGHYGDNRPFPGQTINVDVEDFVVEATATITFPSAGPWTFGVNSDDGFRLVIGSFEVAFPNPRGPDDTLGTFNVPTAGEYPLRLVFYERGGGAGLELFAAPGNRTLWDANNFRLVGDTANGGLAVRSVPVTGASGGGLRDFIGTDLETAMRNRNASAYLRIPFHVPNPSSLESLMLRIRYNDGFVAYLNGQEIARRNAPTTPAWNSTATASRPSHLSQNPEDLNLSDRLALLVPGANLLALHGLNASAADASFLIQPQLVEYRVEATTHLYFTQPTPGALNGSGLLGFTASPRFSVDHGYYDAPFDLELTTLTPGATIRYTTNGTPPTLTNGFAYSTPLRIGGTTTLRAATFKDQFDASPVVTRSYLFADDIIRQSPTGQAPPGWPSSWGSHVVDYGMDPDIVHNPTYAPTIREDLKALPSFSIVMELKDLFDPATGIYANPGQDGADWERPCSVELINPDGTEGFQVPAGIRIRGGFSRSTDNPKHAFRLFFRGEYGATKLEYPLFGDNGTDSFDKLDLRTFQNYSWSFQGDSRGIFVRDQLNRDLQLAMGHQGERGEFYHLYLNGQYWGVFNTCERPEAAFGETYYGGRREDYDVVKVEAGPYTVNATDGNMDAWTRLYQLARAGLASHAAYQFVQGNNPDGTPNPAYENLVDVPNLIDYMLIILYGGNLDAPISNFLGNTRPNNFYGVRDRTGPFGFRFFVHDAEHTLLNVNENRMGPYPAGDTSVLYSSPQWVWQKLQANPEFRLLVADHVHRHFFNGGVLTAPRVRDLFLARTGQLDRAVVGESARWGDAKRSVPYTRANWLGAVNNVLNNFLPQRSGIVLNQLRNGGLYPTVVAPSFNQHGGHVQPGFNLTMSAPAGSIRYTLDGSDPRLPGGQVSPSALTYSGILTLDETVEVKARALNGSTWSALNAATFTLIQTFTNLFITEIMYRPPATEAFSSGQLEFVELKNVGSTELDLSGVQFTSGLRFTFPTGTRLDPGAFLVLAADSNAFSQAYPGVRIDGVYSGQLSNSGERLTLSHAVGTPIFSVRYGDVEPWPPSPDGAGFSLVPSNPNLNPDPDHAANWRASSSPGGSPGRDDPSASIPIVLVNEILAHTELPAVDAIELHNPNAFPVDVGHWYLTDRRTTPKKFRIPSPSIIPAGGFVTFDDSDFNPTPGVEPSFLFSSHGEDVYLYSADADGNLTGYSHGFVFPASANGVSFGRYLTSTGESHYPAQAALTLGAPNAGPRVGPVVINEIHYQPLAGDAEFLELKNLTASPVPLYNLDHPGLTWRLDGLGFSFPPDTLIAANGIILLVSGDPAAFRTKHGVPAGVPIFGPFPGNLQDGGERLRLLRPDNPDLSEDGQPIVPEIVVDEVRYDNRHPWPTEAAGSGASLERLNSQAYGDDPVNWRASPGAPSAGLPNSGNRPPQVSAGPDQSIEASTFPARLNLSGTATDDGLPHPPGSLALAWSQVSGPGHAWFGSPNSPATSVSLPGVGTYILRLTANDGTLEASGDLRVTVTRTTSAATLVAQGATWKYLDTGANLPAAWINPGYDDAAWPSGPAKLGYGDGDEATVVGFGPNANDKHVTTYFRRTFPVAHAASVSNLKVGLRRDDGGIVYLNGTEIFRSNMPEGPITFSTFASSVVGGADETTFYEHPVDPSLLVEGPNVLAVRIHQVNGPSSDLSFDLYLAGTAFPLNSAPTVRAGPDQTITLAGLAQLEGEVTDDGLPIPPGLLTVAWSKASGPGTVAFANDQAVRTTASFTLAGAYTLRLTANDGALVATDDLVITIPGDGYQDWKAGHFTPAELGNPAISGDDADPDLDGHTNHQEYLAGTDPRDPDSILKIVALEPIPADPASLEIRFHTIAGRSYTVQSRASTPGSSWTNLSHVPPPTADGIATITAVNAPEAASRFYRLVTPQQP
ncbi:MAG: lamin tail domain-containing protein [Limisphaerales bacterium]